MKLSVLKVGDRFRFKKDGKIYRVMDRFPEDRISGGNIIRHKDGLDEIWYWDNCNPEIEKV